MRRPTTLLLSAAVSATLLLTACGGQEPSEIAPEATGDPAAAASASAEPEPVVTPDEAQAIAVTVAGGKATGDVDRVAVPLGTTVRLSITSDAPDEVHVHGYDLTSAVSPGQSTQLEFVADQPGVFEVELHDSRLVLTRLQVS